MTVRGMLPTYNLLAATDDGSAVATEVSTATALSLLRVNFKGIDCGLRGWKLSFGRWVLKGFADSCRKFGEIRNEDEEENVAISS